MQAEVEIPKDVVRWFADHRSYPVDVEVDPSHRRIRYANREFVYYPLGGNRFVVTKRASSIPLGEFSLSGVRRAMTQAISRDLRVIRAVVLKQPYDVPVALRLEDGDIVHPGECYEAYQREVGPTAVTEVLHDVNSEAGANSEDDEFCRCVMCQEGF